jgi:UDP-galactopyranose mutase
MERTVLYTSWTDSPDFDGAGQYRIYGYKNGDAWYCYYQHDVLGNPDEHVTYLGADFDAVTRLLTFETQTDRFKEFLENNEITQQDIKEPKQMVSALYNYNFNMMFKTALTTTTKEQSLTELTHYKNHVVSTFLDLTYSDQKSILTSMNTP